MEPEELARATVARVEPMVEALARTIGFGLDGEAEFLHPNTEPLYLAVSRVAAFAKTGIWVHGETPEAAVELIEGALYQRLIDEPGDHCAAKDDWKSPLGLVLAAAHCRLNIAANKPIRADQLAALSGFSVERIRQEIRMGRMQRASKPEEGRRPIDAPILASTAKKWLARRKVAGYV